MYDQFFGYTEELMQPYYRVIKAGNPDAIVAFNNGVKPHCYRHYSEEEFTSGEQVDLSVIPASRFHNGAQTHILLPIGDESRGNGTTLAGGGLHYTKEVLCAYAQKVISADRILTFDCKLNRDGSFDDAQADALRYIEIRL